MEALILAGGLGTRLRSSIGEKQKAIAQIEDLSFLEILLKKLTQSYPFRRITLALGYQAEQVVSLLKKSDLEKKLSPTRLEISVEKEPLGTGGATLLALEKHKPKIESPTLVINGDTFLDLDIQNMAKFFNHHNPSILLAITPVEDISRYGSVKFDEKTFKLISLEEKKPERIGGWINAGAILIDPKTLLKNLTPWLRRASSLERDLIPDLLKNPKTQKTLYVWPHRGEFIDIGTPESYLFAQTRLKKNETN